MKTVKTEDRVTSEVQDIHLGFCVEADDEEADSYKWVSEMDEGDLTKVAKRLKTSPEFLIEIDSVLTELRDATHRELASIWKEVQ